MPRSFELTDMSGCVSRTGKTGGSTGLRGTGMSSGNPIENCSASRSACPEFPRMPSPSGCNRRRIWVGRSGETSWNRSSSRLSSDLDVSDQPVLSSVGRSASGAESPRRRPPGASGFSMADHLSILLICRSSLIRMDAQSCDRMSLPPR